MRIKLPLVKKIALTTLLMFVGGSVFAQALSGGWDASQQYGASGVNDWGNGVVQLQTATFGQTSAAVLETTNPYDPNSGAVFSQCYQVFFACPGGDGIGADAKGDGAAFSFYKATSTYNITGGAFGVPVRVELILITHLVVEERVQFLTRFLSTNKPMRVMQV
ncbi:MAG: hypothetical protein NT150_14850 [Bacteroidetes bacterium]|nr:hypothetical protein [Bacteroidota bacterium]